MNRPGDRLRRVAEQLRREMAVLLREEVKDPRVRMVTLSGVEVSRDLGHAKVYVSVLGDHDAVAAALEGLTRAEGFLRRELGRRMSIRAIPHLHFLHDTSMEQGARINELLEQAKKQRPSEE